MANYPGTSDYDPFGITGFLPGGGFGGTPPWWTQVGYPGAEPLPGGGGWNPSQETWLQYAIRMGIINLGGQSGQPATSPETGKVMNPPGTPRPPGGTEPPQKPEGMSWKEWVAIGGAAAAGLIYLGSGAWQDPTTGEIYEPGVEPEPVEGGPTGGIPRPTGGEIPRFTITHTEPMPVEPTQPTPPPVEPPMPIPPIPGVTVTGNPPQVPYDPSQIGGLTPIPVPPFDLPPGTGATVTNPGPQVPFPNLGALLSGGGQGAPMSGQMAPVIGSPLGESLYKLAQYMPQLVPQLGYFLKGGR